MAVWAAILAWVVDWIACLVALALRLLRGLHPMQFLAVHLLVVRLLAKLGRLLWRLVWLRVTAPR